MRSRQRLRITNIVLVTALASGAAEAAPKAEQAPSKSSTQFTLRREEAGGADATAARQRARAGDCAGALTSFDAAIRGTVDPTLRRDRGLCHEKLANPFPAIDDYRAYLTARPDAPDAPQIRDRLARLEEQVGVGGPSSQAIKDRDASSGEASASVSVSGEGASASSSGGGRAGAKGGDKARGYDDAAADERMSDAAEHSPLRLGTGFIIGPFLSIPRFLVGRGANRSLGYSVGATLRYSFSPSLTFISELGYTGVGTAGERASVGGPLAFVGIELRIPLDPYASNQLIVGGGVGLVRYTVAGTHLSVNVLEARGRFGYRHVFGPSLGLEILLEGGPQALGGGDRGTVGVIGGSYAFVVGF